MVALGRWWRWIGGEEMENHLTKQTKEPIELVLKYKHIPGSVCKPPFIILRRVDY